MAAAFNLDVRGFGFGDSPKLSEPALMLECVRAYNTFIVAWCSEESSRLFPTAAMLYGLA